MPHILIVDSADLGRPAWARLAGEFPEAVLHQARSLADHPWTLEQIDAVLYLLAPDTTLPEEIQQFHAAAVSVIVIASEAIAADQIASLVSAHTVLPLAHLDAFLSDALHEALAETSRRRDAALVSARRTRTVHLYELDNDKTRISAFAGRLLQECDRYDLFDERDRFRTQIALEEALLNATVHGNLEVSSRLREEDHDAFGEMIALRQSLPEYATRRVHVTFDVDRTAARFVIRDEGPGFDVSRLPDPRETDRIELASGRGVLLMRSFMDDVQYNARGNEVRMLKQRSASLSPADATPPAQECGQSCAVAAS